MKKNNFKVIIFYLVLISLVILVSSSLLNLSGTKEMTSSEIIRLFEEDKVKEFTVSPSGELTVITTENKKIIFDLQSIHYFREDVQEYVDKNLKNEDGTGGNLEKYHYEPVVSSPWWINFLPYILIILVLVGLYFYAMNQTTGGKGGRINSFGKARAKMGSNEKKKVFFSDVAGADEEKEELAEVVDFLKDPARFQELGARIPHGVLLVGPPGTDKTLLAKAVAGEAGVPFFSISGSDFVEMFVGVGASRVRDLFETAKKCSPCIIFIDEIDAVGRHRGAGLGGGHDEREQTLNQLLVEMDGFGVNEGVIIIAATNRPDILDRALLRPGRFDRQVLVDAPDVKGREEILKVHAKGKPLADDVKLDVLAKTTVGFTGADLENLMNEAALRAARQGAEKITMFDLEESIMKVIAGPEKKTRVVTEKERKLTAFHEAGHAVVSKMLPTQDRVHQVSIIPRGRAGGYTLSLPKEDTYFMSKTEMIEEIISLLGGRVAEKLVLNDISTGASNDIERATTIAKNMIVKYGMSDNLGSRTFGGSNDEVFIGRDFGHTKDYSEAVAAQIDSEIKSIIDDCYKKCENILTEQNDKLHKVAELLLEKEKIEEDEFESIFAVKEIAEEVTENE